MATGILLAESIRLGPGLENVSLSVSKIYRFDAGDEAAGQPRTWTFIEFEVPDTQGEYLAEASSVALEPRGGWYCDFGTSDETFVAFAGRVFRYPRGDPAGRAEAEGYARSVGVPDPQLDWPE